MKFASLVERITGKGSRAWDCHGLAQQRLAKGDDIILLSVGDPDFDTPAPIVEAAVESLRSGRHHYTPSAGIAEFRQIIADRHQKKTGQPTNMENVVVTSGSQNALMTSALCILDAGDEVIAPQPMYVTYEGVVGATGATLVTVPMPAEKEFQVDPKDIEAAITPRTRAILLNTPHNPTGCMLHGDTLARIAEICCENDLWLVSDEVYADITFEGEHISPCSFPGMAERTVTISGLSKSHAMTGWRCGWLVAPTQLAEHVETLAGSMLYGLPPFIQDAGMFALTENLRELDTMKVAYRGRRDLVCDALAEIPGLIVHKPEAGMFVMVDIKATGYSSQLFMEQLLDEEGVSILSGEAFGPGGAGLLRISLAETENKLLEGCKRIARFFRSLDLVA